MQWSYCSLALSHQCDMCHLIWNVIQLVTVENTENDKTYFHVNLPPNNSHICSLHAFLKNISFFSVFGSMLFTSKLSMYEYLSFCVNFSGAWPILQIPWCIRQISHNASFCNRNTCAYFCCKNVFCGIQDWWIVGFVQLVFVEKLNLNKYCTNIVWNTEEDFFNFIFLNRS